ncbi:MAG: DMT family transporter [Oscillospiraceae bacterium]
MEKSKNIGYVLAVTAGAFWAFSGLCGQFLFENRNLTSNWLVPVRLISAGLIILIVSFIKSGTAVFDVWRKKRDAADISLFGILGTALCQYGYFTAIGFSNAATATVLEYTAPVLIVAYISVRHRHMPSRRELISALLAVFGVFLCATHGSFDTLVISGKALFWCFVAAVSFCFYSIQPHRLLEKHASLSITGWGMLIGGVTLCLIFRPWHLTGIWDIWSVLALAGIVIPGTVLAFAFYMQAVKYIGSARASILSTDEPVVSTILSIFWLGTPLGAIDILGFVMIISTIFILSVKKNGI